MTEPKILTVGKLRIALAGLDENNLVCVRVPMWPKAILGHVAYVEFDPNSGELVLILDTRP